MVELTTYLYPAVQGLFCLVSAAVWLVGFLRQRNFGFLLLTLATLAEGVTSLVRPALFNYVIYHQPNLSTAERSTTVGMIGTTGSRGLCGVLACYRPGRTFSRVAPIKISSSGARISSG